MDLRDPIKDYELYKETCQELQRLMAEIQELKSRGIKDNVREASGGVAGCVDYIKFLDVFPLIWEGQELGCVLGRNRETKQPVSSKIRYYLVTGMWPLAVHSLHRLDH